MKKAPDAFRTISEVSDWLDTPAHVLRFWESKFQQIKPVKRAGGRRYYRPDDMRLLGGIKQLLHNDGMTIKGVQKILREKGIKHVAALSQSVTDTQVSSRSEQSSKPATGIDRISENIRQQVADATATDAQKPEPLILSPDLIKSAEVEKAPPAPRQEPEAFVTPKRPAPAAEAAVPEASQTDATESGNSGQVDSEEISALYGRLKSLRRRMRES